jgi:integrase
VEPSRLQLPVFQLPVAPRQPGPDDLRRVGAGLAVGRPFRLPITTPPKRGVRFDADPPDGDRLHPQHVSDQFLWLAYLAGLPPIQLHDLRHGAASLMLAAGVEIKVVQETLGHTSSAFTADTYTSVFPQVAAAAEKTAALLLGDDDQQGRSVLRHLRA